MNRRSFILSILASPFFAASVRAEPPKRTQRTWSIQTPSFELDCGYWIDADKIRFVSSDEWSVVGGYQLSVDGNIYDITPAYCSAASVSGKTERGAA